MLRGPLSAAVIRAAAYLYAGDVYLRTIRRRITSSDRHLLTKCTLSRTPQARRWPRGRRLDQSHTKHTHIYTRARAQRMHSIKLVSREKGSTTSESCPSNLFRVSSHGTLVGVSCRCEYTRHTCGKSCIRRDTLELYSYRHPAQTQLTEGSAIKVCLKADTGRR